MAAIRKRVRFREKIIDFTTLRLVSSFLFYFLFILCLGCYMGIIALVIIDCLRPVFVGFIGIIEVFVVVILIYSSGVVVIWILD